MNDYSELPNLPQIFRSLLKGRHISINDEEYWYNLRGNLKGYQDYFRAIGYNLIAHRKEFYYFKLASKTNTEGPKQIALFVFILIDYLDRKEADLSKALLSQRFKYDELPHFKTERYKELMGEVKISDEERLTSVIDVMQKYGIATIYPGDSFEFNTPVYRFFDVCISQMEKIEGELDEHRAD